MPVEDVPTGALALVERLAGAVRDALGAEIDAYPGATSPERADPINRAFRAVVRSLLEADDIPGPSLPALVSRTLRRAAQDRLAAEGWDDRLVRLLLDLEPGCPDDWLAYVRRVTPQCIPFPERRPSGNGPGSSGLPTTERYGGPQHAGEAGRAGARPAKAPQDPRGRVEGVIA